MIVHEGTRAVRAGAIACVGTLLLFAGCTTAPADSDSVFSLSADVLPFPAVVAGDTLRNADGVASRLSAIAYNGDGEVIPDAPIEYFSTDPDVTVADGFLVAEGATGRTVRTYARVGSMTLEISSASPLQVVAAPETLEASGELPDSVSYESPSIRSEPMSVALRGAPTDQSPEGEPVPGWIVDYVLEYRGSRLPADDLRFRLVEPGGSGAVAAPQDTTDSGGLASREVVVLDTSDIAQGETLVVIITARHLGENVTGSPMAVTLRLTAAP